MPGHSGPYSWLGHKSDSSYRERWGGPAALGETLVALAVLRTANLFTSQWRRVGIVIREASGRVSSHSPCTLICQSGRVCTIPWKGWDVGEMSRGVVKQVHVLKESASLIAYQPIGGNRMISSDPERRGGKKWVEEASNSSQFSLVLHLVLHPWLLRFFGAFFCLGGCSLLWLVLSCPATLRYPGFIGRFWCLMWSEVDLIWEKKDCDTLV